jgi:hypothetical protein
LIAILKDMQTREQYMRSKTLTKMFLQPFDHFLEGARRDIWHLEQKVLKVIGGVIHILVVELEMILVNFCADEKSNLPHFLKSSTHQQQNHLHLHFVALRGLALDLKFE